MTATTKIKIDESKKSATLSAALTQDAYAALCEHAWRQRRSVGSMVREALEDKGWLTMPQDAVQAEV